jgi:hypothetical protein
MDGFDEISPIHADKADVILSELMKTEVARVWVTSRPVEKERLERMLSVIAFSMKKLSRESQEEMLRYLWLDKAGETEVTPETYIYIKEFLFNLNHSIHDDNFTGCPLYITMIATVHEMDMEGYLISGNWFHPNAELLNLYETFVERKLLLYLTQKKKADIYNAYVLDDYEEKKKRDLTDFEGCALVAILPASILKSLHNKKIGEEIQSFLDRVQDGKDKTGIVTNVVDGKPQFVHRTFIEYEVC